MDDPNSTSEISYSLLDFHVKLTEISLLVRRKLLDHFDRKGITLNKYRVLRFLRQVPNLSLSSLEEKTMIKKGNLSKLVDSLVRQKLVFRQQNSSSDRRIIELSLTQKGIKILEKEEEKQNKLILTLYQSIPEEKIKEYGIQLSDLLRYLQRRPDFIN